MTMKIRQNYTYMCDVCKTEQDTPEQEPPYNWFEITHNTQAIHACDSDCLKAIITNWSLYFDD